MKKHFLLIMLMALLPLAGWAQTDIGAAGFTFKLDKSTVPYTAAAVDVAEHLSSSDYEEELDLGVDYSLLYFQNNEQLEGAPTDCGTYQVQAQGIEPVYTGTTQKITFTIIKGEIPADAVTAPTAKDDLTYTGGAKALLNDDGAVDEAYGTIKYSMDGINWQTGIPQGINAGTYTIAWKVEGSENYNDYVAEEGSTIEAVIAPAPAEYATVTEGLPVDAVTYNGSEQLVSGVTVIVKASAEAEEVLATYANPTIVYYTNAERTTEAESVVNAGTYYLKVTQPEGANYGFTLTGVTEAAENGYTYKINPQDLIISVAANEKVYDGTPLTLADAQFTPGSLAAGDADATIGALAAIQSDAEGDFGDGDEVVGSYGVKVNKEALTIKKTVTTIVEGVEAEVEVNVKPNYNIIVPEKNWKIIPKALSIIPEPKSIAVGTRPNTLIDGNAGNEELSFDIEGAVMIPEEDGEVEAGSVRDDYTPLMTLFVAVFDETKIDETKQASTTLDPQTFNDAIIVRLKEGADEMADYALLANYEYDVTENKAALTIQGKDFTIVPSVTSVEYGTPVQKGYNAYNANLSEASVKEGTLVYQYKLVDEEDWTNWDDEEPTAVGNYMVRFDPEGLIEGDGANVGGVANDDAISLFSINKRTLIVTVTEKTVHQGDPAEVINEIGELEYASEDHAPLADDEEAVAELLTYSFDTDKVSIDPETEKILGFTATAGAVDGTAAECITVTLAENDNYVITGLAKGALTISDSYELVIGGDNTAEMIAAANENGSENVSITFASREMKKDNWYAVVLPFKTSAKELVNALNTYVVINRLNPEVTDKIAFQLAMGDIPAGEPFLIKPAETFDWATGYVEPEEEAAEAEEAEEEAEAEPVYLFNGKTIEAAVPGEVAAPLATFKGLYASYDVKWEKGVKKEGFLAYDGETFGTKTLINKWYAPSSAAHTNGPLTGYLLYASESGAPIITVEDFDGTVTAIQTVKNGEFTEVKADGWYTVGGMKLQSAPAKKGVYINNGKKVIK